MSKKNLNIVEFENGVEVDESKRPFMPSVECEGVDEEAIGSAVDDWLKAHPEATTTVQDGSLTKEKFADGVLPYVTPEMFGAVGDGVADDSDAFVAALSTGLPVLLANSYKVHKKHTFANPVTMVGTKQSKIILDSVTPR